MHGRPSSARAPSSRAHRPRGVRETSRFAPRRFYPGGSPSMRCMDFALTETQEITRKTVRDFAEQEIIPQSHTFDESQEFPHAWAKKMGELGLLGVFVPEKYGGAGLDTVCYAITIEELSRGDASAGVIAAVCNGLVCEPLLHYGTEGQKRKFLEPVARGEWLGAYALTEPGSGSDAAAMRTTATLERNEWVLRGTKTFATNASVAKIVVVYARTGAKKHEISAFVVPTDAKGFSVLKKEDKMGIRASDTVTLGFDGCRIQKDNLLGELHKGFTIAMATLDGGRIGIAAQALGIAQRALDESTKYAKERQAFGQKIADFQAIQWKLADMATEIDAARLLTYRAAHLEDLGQRHTYESSVAKLFASEAAHRAVDAAVQIHGGGGIIKKHGVGEEVRRHRSAADHHKEAGEPATRNARIDLR